ncbi:MAG: glycosyltransferase [Verrucomicrobiota bacterium]
MIYIDVTSSCKWPRPTGVQRCVRGMYLDLKKRSDVMPLVWQESLQTYCRLTPNQHVHLRDLSLFPLEQRYTSKISRILQFIGNRWRPVDLQQELQAGDVFLQAEIFQDDRIEWMQRVFPEIPEVRKVGVFYDALNWSHSHLSATGRLTRFEDYMQQFACFDALTAISEFSADAIQEFWQEVPVKGPEPKVIYPVLGWKKRPKLKSTRERTLRIPYVATLEPRKNHLALLDACEQLWDEGRDFQLVLVGREGPGQGKQISGKIKKWIKEGKPLEWYSGMSDFGVKRLYQQARFTLYPSLVEGFGLPILESLWFGAPCLCHQEGAVAETSQGGGCYRVDVKRVESLADGIRKMLDDQKFILRLSREAKERKFRFWSDYVDNLQKLW